MNTPVTASVVWTDPRGNAIPINETRRQVIPPTGNSLVSMLLFQPIDTGHNNDGGTYSCQMIINSDNSLITSSQPTNTTHNVTVESKVYCTKIDTAPLLHTLFSISYFLLYYFYCFTIYHVFFFLHQVFLQ